MIPQRIPWETPPSMALEKEAILKNIMNYYNRVLRKNKDVRFDGGEWIVGASFHAVIIKNPSDLTKGLEILVVLFVYADLEALH